MKLRVHVVFFLLVCSSASVVHAGYVVIPADDHTQLDIQFDRSLPPKLERFIWHEKGAGQLRDPHDEDPYDVLRATFVCHSSTDASTGACATAPAWKAETAASQIRFKMTEERSRTEVEITAIGGQYRFGMHRSVRLPLNEAVPSELMVGRILEVKITPSEYEKIPHAGVWKGRIKLKQVKWEPRGERLANYTADIKFIVTDKNNISIYFPKRNNAAPTVNLNLINRSLVSQSGQTDGHASLDMCLYDGYGANSDSYEIRASDGQSVPGRAAHLFSVAHADAGSTTDPSTRVDYSVTLDYNGARLPLNNNESKVLPGVDKARTRRVNIPNIRGSVLCTPTPLTLHTDGFDSLSKRAGEYQGRLRIEFTPRTTVPG